MAKAIGEKVVYRKSSNFLRTWSDGQGEVCDIEGVALSMARPAPRVVHGAGNKEVPPRATRTLPTAKRKSDDPYVNVLNTAIDAAEALGKFSRWLKTPPPPAPPKPTRTSPAAATVPPFDIQDIPKAMRKLGMPMSAKLQERWFAGKANYSKSPRDLMREINQDGESYSPSMVDSTTIKMEWVLSFTRAREAFEELIRKNIRSPQALEILRTKLFPYRQRLDIACWDAANSNWLEFHRNFQFQLKEVNSTWGQRMNEFLRRASRAGGVPDDLTGALGSFNFYVAPRFAYFDDARRAALVDEVAVYVRDPYEFSDDQYLGHWNGSHVAVVPAHQLVGGSSQDSGWIVKPIMENRRIGVDSALYPVTNKDYRDWRHRHNQGGDFMIYTDRMNVKVNPPLKVFFQ